MRSLILCNIRLNPRQLRSNSIGFCRTFLTTSAQTLTATRNLPYTRSALYDLVADIPSYPIFLPYCNHAKVLAWSNQDSMQRKWPARALLSVGWGKLQEQYISRVYCVPGRVVEAIAGNAQTLLSKSELKIYEGVGSEHGLNENISDDQTGGDVFQSLRTRWTLEDLDPKAGNNGTRVNLCIDFLFQSPLYAALSSAALPKIAGTVIDAFEGRANEVLGGGKSI